MQTTSTTLPSLYVLEPQSAQSIRSIAHSFETEGFKVAASVMGLCDSLSKDRKVVWVEDSDVLHPHVALLIKSYASGIVSFAHEGKTVSFRFDPAQARLSVILPRAVLEKSSDSLFAFVGEVISK